MTINLSTRYLGLDLPNPLIAGASPMTDRLDGLRRLEDAGVAAVVMPSIFEEQIEHVKFEMGWLQEYGAESFPEALRYFPDLGNCYGRPETHLAHIEAAKKELRVPVIGSLNGSSPGGWVRYARRVQEAGADALELNVYSLAADPGMTSRDIEGRTLEIVQSVREAVTIPLAVKIGPYYSALANFAARLAAAGADGLVLFNRFLQPDIDLESLEVTPNLVLSSSLESRLAVRWIAILSGQVQASLAATGGAHVPEDVLKLLLVGADAVQLASCLLQHGPGHVRTLLAGVEEWLEKNDYRSVAQMKGSLSQERCPDPAAFERANYMKALTTYSPRVHV